MQIPSTSRIRMFVPVWGPLGEDLTGYPCQLAVIVDEEGREPADGEYHAGQWIDGEATMMPPGAAPATWGDTWEDGQYVAWVKVDAGDEIPVMKAGRVRIGELGSEG